MTYDGGWTAASVAEAVRSGQVSAVDMVTESLRRIGERDGRLHAFQVVRGERALADAAEVDARPDRDRLPLAGVPIAVKDNVPVAGEPMRDGSAVSPDAPQDHDHPVVARLRAAGAVVVGITRLPELGVWGTTDSTFGVTYNPWNLGRTPGGSSGGSAAAVASGMVPVAHGNDGMGSIRIPAACTGLVGIKPGLGVVPCEMGRTDWYGLVENGPLATTPADAALVLSVMADRPEWAELAVPQRTLDIATSIRVPVMGVQLDPVHEAAVATVADVLRAAGHTVAPDEVHYTQGAAVGALARWFAGTAGDAEAWDVAGMERAVRTHAAIGRAVRRTPLMSESMRTSWQEHMTAYLTQHDVLITPALATPPIDARTWWQASWAARVMGNVRYAPYAAPWNLAGFPALVVPVGVHPTAGTPVGVQLVGRPGTEPLLLGVAALLEEAHPWRKLAPMFDAAPA